MGLLKNTLLTNVSVVNLYILLVIEVLKMIKCVCIVN